MEKLARKFTEFLFKNRVENNEQLEVYNYAIALILSTFITGVSSFIINSIIFTIWEAVAFLLVFSIVRAFSGGYHCSTYVACYLITIIIGTITIALSRALLSLNSGISTVILYVILSVSNTIIVYYSPSPDPKKRLTAKRFEINRRVAAILASLFSVSIIIIRSTVNSETVNRIVYCSVLSLLSVSILLIYKKIIERRRKNV